MSLRWSFLLCECCWDFCSRAQTAETWDRQHHSRRLSLSLVINSNINNGHINNNINNIHSLNNTDRERVNQYFFLLPPPHGNENNCTNGSQLRGRPSGGKNVVVLYCIGSLSLSDKMYAADGCWLHMLIQHSYTDFQNSFTMGYLSRRSTCSKLINIE